MFLCFYVHDQLCTIRLEQGRLPSETWQRWLILHLEMICLLTCTRGSSTPGTHGNDTATIGAACPYHQSLLELRPSTSRTSDLPPMTRFQESTGSELPFGFLGQTSIGTAASGGCNCVESSMQEPDPLARELNAIVSSHEDNANTSAAQPR